MATVRYARCRREAYLHDGQACMTAESLTPTTSKALSATTTPSATRRQVAALSGLMLAAAVRPFTHGYGVRARPSGSRPANFACPCFVRVLFSKGHINLQN